MKYVSWCSINNRHSYNHGIYFREISWSCMWFHFRVIFRLSHPATLQKIARRGEVHQPTRLQSTGINASIFEIVEYGSRFPWS